MAKKKKAKTAEEKTFQEELTTQLVTLSTSGFGFVAALAWNDTIQQFMNQVVASKIPGSGILSKFLYALLITLLAVLITFQLSRLAVHLQHKR